MSITGTLEIITSADLDTAVAEATSTVDANCPVQKVTAAPLGAGLTTIRLTALFASHAEVEAKAAEVRHAVGRWGSTDVIVR